jgi:hypothetical protein
MMLLIMQLSPVSSNSGEDQNEHSSVTRLSG